MNLATRLERAQRTAPQRCFSGGHLHGPILPMEQPRRSWWRWLRARDEQPRKDNP